MKIANIDKEFLHILWTTWGNSVKYSGKICFEIISHEKPGFHRLFRRYIFQKTTGGGLIWPPPLPLIPPGILGLKTAKNSYRQVTEENKQLKHIRNVKKQQQQQRKQQQQQREHHHRPKKYKKVFYEETTDSDPEENEQETAAVEEEIEEQTPVSINNNNNNSNNSVNYHKKQK